MNLKCYNYLKNPSTPLPPTKYRKKLVLSYKINNQILPGIIFIKWDDSKVCPLIKPIHVYMPKEDFVSCKIVKTSTPLTSPVIEAYCTAVTPAGRSEVWKKWTLKQLQCMWQILRMFCQILVFSRNNGLGNT